MVVESLILVVGLIMVSLLDVFFCQQVVFCFLRFWIEKVESVFFFFWLFNGLFKFVCCFLIIKCWVGLVYGLWQEQFDLDQFEEELV